MYINSPGGVVTAGLAIYDTMQYIRCPVSTLAIGQAASMASLLLAAGEPGQRRTLPHSRVMLHQPSGGAQVRRGGRAVRRVPSNKQHVPPGRMKHFFCVSRGRMCQGPTGRSRLGRRA